MAKKVGICKLCGQNKKFMKAHIISKFLFKDLFEFEKVHLVSVKDLDSRNLVQDSMYDTSILCKECDNTFSSFESYFKEILDVHKNKSNKLRMEELSYYHFTVVTYHEIQSEKIRQFLNIIIWRTSLSNQRNFKYVTLGSKIENNLYQQIKQEIPLDFDFLPVIIIDFHNVNDVRKMTVLTPYIFIDSNGIESAIIFLINEIMFAFNLGGNFLQPFYQYRITNDDCLRIIKPEQELGVILLDTVTRISGDFRQH